MRLAQVHRGSLRYPRRCASPGRVRSACSTGVLDRQDAYLKLRESSQRRFESSVLALQQFRRREVDLARLKCRVIRDAHKAQIDYETVLASEYPWIC